MISNRDSAATLEAVINTAIDGIIIINEKGIIELINPAALDMFGYTEEELSGENVSTLMSNPHHDKHDGYINRYLETGQKRIIGIGREVAGLRKDGTLFPCRLSVSEVKLKSRVIFAGFIHDLTEEKEAERKLQEYAEELESKVHERTLALDKTVEKLTFINKTLQKEIKERKAAEISLKESQRLYKIVSRNFPNGTIGVLDNKFNYIFVEGRELAKLGLASEDLVGKSIGNTLSKEVREYIIDQLKGVLKGETTTFEFSTDGKKYHVQAVPLAGATSKANQILVVQENVTELRKIEQEMQRALEKERELSNMKSKFVSMASHEFRTPLSTILSSANLISRYEKPENRKQRDKHIERIKSNIEHLTNILNDFLSLSKLEEGKIELTPSNVEIASFLKECVEDTQGNLKPGQKIKIIDNTDNQPFVTDAYLLKNIVLNLISNAIKYSEKNIEIHAGITVGRLQIDVIDFGIGIPQSEQQNMFERFFRASNATNIQGTGLGLNLVNRYVKMLKGNITFDSQANIKTVFTVQLPQLAKHEKDITH